ncbi:hypothetical protein F383_35903 [Gossypium arboreum]|uniref:Uncharacterized protein n=1 Tax=Gossypium arboreum TaxID=29729 RepID=A0A0B0N713_GOSAR|nr:hypothetical protein F383_35903 [Gossypium arboreum]
MPYLHIHMIKSTNWKMDSVMCNSDLSRTSEERVSIKHRKQNKVSFIA